MIPYLGFASIWQALRAEHSDQGTYLIEFIGSSQFLAFL